jgi:hypothetical protein
MEYVKKLLPLLPLALLTSNAIVAYACRPCANTYSAILHVYFLYFGNSTSILGFLETIGVDHQVLIVKMIRWVASLNAFRISSRAIPYFLPFPRLFP